MKTKPKFYELRQNNSGGSFHTNGLTVLNLIEADSASEANERAEELGAYFDGCNEGRDCSCCGDRWYRMDDSDCLVFPYVYSSFSKEMAQMIAKEYGGKIKKNPKFDYDVEFSDIESYIKFYINKYFKMSFYPDSPVKVFYKNGKTKTFSK